METKPPTPTAAGTPQPKKEEKKDNKIMFIIIIALLFVSNGVLGWLYYQERLRKNEVIVEKEKVMVERESIKGELLQLQKEYGDIQTTNTKISAELEEKRAQIAEMIIEAEKHKDDAQIIAKLKRETGTLRRIMKSYIGTIDSLNTLNKTLIVEKDKVTGELTQEKTKSSQLTKEKEDLSGVVKLGSVLKANNIRATGVRYRSGGKKEIETTKARRTEKIKVNFILGENRIAKKGTKDVFMRCLTPEGKELARSMDDANSFSFNGVRGFFCAKQTISYDNQEMGMALLAEMKEGFPPGKYMIEVYADEAMIGQTTLVLE